jgi:ubiquinone/menaquinone biosynthesis C-methylase UbiE
MEHLSSKGLRVSGVDLSAKMVRFATARKVGPVVQADMRTLPFPDASFAGVWSFASLLHIPKADVPEVLGEFARVLADGGVLALSLKLGEGEGVEQDIYPVERFFARYQESELRCLLAVAGFQVAELWRDVRVRDTWLITLALRVPRC